MKNLFNRQRLTSLFNAALLGCLAAGPAALNAQTYNLTDLGTLPRKTETSSAPTALNNKGQVAGNSGQTAFRYQNNGKEALEDLGGKYPGRINRAFGINSSGQVVGDSTFGPSGEMAARLRSHAALFNEGAVTDLGTLRKAGNYSRANGINASGQVVGFAGPERDSTASRAFLWTSSTGMTDLGTLGGAYAQAMAINESGFVTGNSQIADKSNAIHAFLWHAKPGFHDLGTIAGDYSYGTFINAQNHVVGYSTIEKEGRRVHAFLHDGTNMRDLGSLGGKTPENDQSFALGVNANDEIVGYSYLPTNELIAEPQQVAFLYRNGVMVNLNELIGGAAKRYLLYSATAINDEGQIAAIALDNTVNAFRAILLTPMVKITNATYWADYQALVVEATIAEKQTNAVVEVWSPTGEKLGALDDNRNNDGSYSAKLPVAANPKQIVVVSSLGGTDRTSVQEVSTRLTHSKR